MLDYKKRVIEEKRELDEKKTLLYDFIFGDLFDTVDPEEQGRLFKQLTAMRDYSEILRQRIWAFTA
jgi:hypothetical protein